MLAILSINENCVAKYPLWMKVGYCIVPFVVLCRCRPRYTWYDIHLIGPCACIFSAQNVLLLFFLKKITVRLYGAGRCRLMETRVKWLSLMQYLS